jgi:hypothetical protein
VGLRTLPREPREASQAVNRRRLRQAEHRRVDAASRGALLTAERVTFLHERSPTRSPTAADTGEGPISRPLRPHGQGVHGSGARVAPRGGCSGRSPTMTGCGSSASPWISCGSPWSGRRPPPGRGSPRWTTCWSGWSRPGAEGDRLRLPVRRGARRRRPRRGALHPDHGPGALSRGRGRPDSGTTQMVWPTTPSGAVRPGRSPGGSCRRSRGRAGSWRDGSRRSARHGRGAQARCA